MITTFFKNKMFIITVAAVCWLSGSFAAPASAAVGDSKKRIEQHYGSPDLVQDQSDRIWTVREWQEQRKDNPKSYGYLTAVSGINASLWIEFNSNRQAVKETLLMDEAVKIRHFEQYFGDLYPVVISPDSKAVISIGFPRDQLGMIARMGNSQQFIRFILTNDDKTKINMHSKIRGFEITEQPPGEWRAADNYFRPELYFSERLIPRTGTELIVIHHAAMAATTSRADIHDLHLSNGWAGIGYHKVILADGTVEAGRPATAIGAHAYGANTRSIGIVLVGNFEEQLPTSDQLAALVQVTRELMKQYKIPLEKVLPHREATKGTLCPGTRFPWEEFKQRLQGRG